MNKNTKSAKDYPNCTSCSHKKLINFIYPFGSQEVCEGQGSLFCSSVYANKHCFKIYKRKA
jgi:hypothetical protein